MRTNRGPFLCLSALVFISVWSGSARGEWVTEPVDTYHNVGLLTSLAVDSYGAPHISYYDQTHYCLKYASMNGSYWYTQVVDTGHVGAHSSLAFYQDNAPRISYTSYDPVQKVVNGVKYAQWNGSSWNTQFVQSGSNLGEYTSLAVDNMGRPHISYYDKGLGALKYAAWDGTQWNIQTVDTGGTGLYTSLKLDYLGNPRIAYHDETNETLRYAAWDGSAWHYTTVDSSAHVGAHPSLALTSTNDPIISYFDSTNTDLKVAMYYNDDIDGAHWHVGAVDTAGIVGFANSLAMDSELGLLCIAYAVGDPAVDTDLKFAYWDGTAWQFEIVDSPGIVGEFASLALDPVTRMPMVSYYDRTNGDLKFATPALSHTPEPATLCLVALGAFVALTRRNRTRQR
jgi:hypothetical protein